MIWFVLELTKTAAVVPNFTVFVPAKLPARVTCTPGWATSGPTEARAGVMGAAGLWIQTATVAMEVGGQPLTLLVKRAYNESDIFIDLLRPGAAAERIWALDERPRRVSKTEYEHTFEKR